MPFSGAGTSGVIEFPASRGAPANDSVTVTASAIPPSGVTPFSTPTVFVYLGVTFSQTTTLSAEPTTLFTLANAPFNPAAGPMYLRLYDPATSAWTPNAFGAGTVDQSSLVFTGSGTAFTFVAGKTYVFALNQPSTLLSVTPNSVQILGTGSSSQQAIAVQEAGYTGTFSESDTCSGIATIASASTSGSIALYTATGVAAGSCNATFSDNTGQKQTIAISVTTVGFGIQ